MAQSLQLRVIAEGVENQEAMDFLAWAQASPAVRSRNTPRVTVTLAMSVVSATMLAARRSLPPKALTMTKLAAAVGLAKNRNISPSSRPSNPASHAVSVHSTGNVTIFMTLALIASLRSLRMELSDSVPPMHINARGRVRDAK